MYLKNRKRIIRFCSYLFGYWKNLAERDNKNRSKKGRQPLPVTPLLLTICYILMGSKCFCSPIFYAMDIFERHFPMKYYTFLEEVFGNKTSRNF